jgi:hypothetical protein
MTVNILFKLPNYICSLEIAGRFKKDQINGH